MALDDDIAILAQAPLLGLIGRDALRLIVFAAERRSLAAGETLFLRGDVSDGGYVVLAGTLALTSRSPKVAPFLAEPGALVGRHALFLSQKRPATAVARTPCEVMRITPVLMQRVLAVFPEAAAAIHEVLSDDLTDLAQGLERARAAFL